MAKTVHKQEYEIALFESMKSFPEVGWDLIASININVANFATTSVSFIIDIWLKTVPSGPGLTKDTSKTQACQAKGERNEATAQPGVKVVHGERQHFGNPLKKGLEFVN